MQKTVFPDIMKIFGTFDILTHIAAIFKSVVSPHKNEIVDEFEDV